MKSDPQMCASLRPRTSLAFALVTTFALSACGYCDGALRTMRAESYSAPRPDANGRFPLAARASFQLRADGPSEADAKLQELSGVDQSSWQLIADSTGQPVPATVSADSGGNACLNGVTFHLKVASALPAGTYTLVLSLEKVRWRVVGDAEQIVGAYGAGRTRALVVRYAVP